MVDLRVIDGGGGEGSDKQAQWAEEMAAQALERLAVEILRGVARGPENSYRVGTAVRDLYEHLTPESIRVRLYATMDAGLRSANSRLLPENPYKWDDEFPWLLKSALRLAAETIATDGFARGRASQRRSDFDHSIEQYVLQKEERSREGGRSYLKRLLEQLPPLPSSPSPTRVKRAKKRKPATTSKKPA
ncbi:hypothetical protein [Ancylobacter oerskovii]|uniref:Uncharacterized protein n=1 Tax=Ancylobacter oerskovii TaxID=459519 RepID=A0ABW4YVK6_9HYPH|nr:hypothetical protein [Ancylobacter oerskovii]MBS7544332.1 hypothetical protein [Ancylobacter oerskovii]